VRAKDRTVEQELARMAERAHGVVTRAQLLRAGVTRAEIAWRVRTGALIRVHRAVYRVGHVAPSLEARYLAAVLGCGEHAVLSGRAAAYLYGLVKGKAPPAEVTVPTCRRLEGIKVRRSRGLDADDVKTFPGIPVMSVARTLVDLASYLPKDELARACHEAGVRYGTTPRMVEVVLERHPRCKGAAKLRAVLRGEVRVSLSRLEKRFLRHVADIERPLPVTNRPAGGRRVDCRWPDHHLTVELDSYTYHHSRHAWEQDRRREREAHARGDDLRRYTWGDVCEHPAAMLDELRALLPKTPSR